MPPQILSNISSSHNITQDKGRVILFSTLGATVEKMNKAIIRRKLYLKKNAKHIRQVAQAYRHRNLEKIRVWESRYREKNRELIRTRNRIYQKRYKQRHKKEIQEYQRIYRAKNQNKKSINLKKEKSRLKNKKKASRPRVSEDESYPRFTCPFETDSQQIERLDLITSLLQTFF